MLVGAAGVLLANDALERASLGVTLRTSRATGTAAAVGESLGTRIREAFTTTIGLNRFQPDLDFLLGGLIVATVAYGAWSLRDQVVTRGCSVLRRCSRPRAAISCVSAAGSASFPAS